MQPKILFVDDEESIHKLLKRAFQETSFTLLSAHDGEEGLRLADQEEPNVILLDVNMPKLDGYGVMRELRKNKKTRYIPVLMLTGNGEVVDKMVGYELGVEDYVTKPFKPNEIIKHVANLL